MTTVEPLTRRSERRTLVAVWLVLTAGTVIAWGLAPGHTVPGTLTACGIAFVAFVKCRFVLRYFMEIRHAPRLLRLVTDIWLVTLWAGLLGMYSVQ